VSCSASGYLIQDTTLYSVDLTTGDVSLIAQTVGSGASINAMGFNVLDNYLYARDGDNNRLRISGDGKSQVVGQLSTSINANVGDVDTYGYYWFGAGGVSTGLVQSDEEIRLLSS
jgi:hypothetical protein